MESDIQAGKKAGCRTALISREYSLLDFARELRKTAVGKQKERMSQVRCKNCQREMEQGYVLIHDDDDIGTIEMYFCGKKESPSPYTIPALFGGPFALSGNGWRVKSKIGKQQPGKQESPVRREKI